MNDVEVILNGPDYFKCERLNARMPKKDCFQRQYEYDRLYYQYSRGLSQEHSILERLLSLEKCRGCGQGKKIRAKIMETLTRPKRGEGDRKADCRYYNDCLDHAAGKDWKTFNCESCEQYQGGDKSEADKPENKRVCSECQKNKTISPKHSLCSSCMAKRSNEARKRPKGPVTPKRKNAAHDKHKPEKASHAQYKALTIEFGEHGDILKEIEKLAVEEVRPLECQVIFMLKKYLELENTTA